MPRGAGKATLRWWLCGAALLAGCADERSATRMEINLHAVRDFRDTAPECAPNETGSPEFVQQALSRTLEPGMRLQLLGRLRPQLEVCAEHPAVRGKLSRGVSCRSACSSSWYLVGFSPYLETFRLDGLSQAPPVLDCSEAQAQRETQNTKVRVWGAVAAYPTGGRSVLRVERFCQVRRGD